MSRLETRFRNLRDEGRGGLVAFVTAGDPTPDLSAEILAGLPDAGADIIELGMPFTDPMADGPSIELASGRALAAGQNMKKTLAMVAKFRETDNDTPVVLMGYYNPIHAYGGDAFAADAGAAGVDGLIVVDLPPEEEAEFAVPAASAGIDIVRLIAPTSTDDRIGTLVQNASGFVYYVSVRGITGTSSAAASDIAANVGRIRALTDLPVAVGFGIRTPEQAAEVAAVADAAVVGTAIVEKIAGALDDGGAPTSGLVLETLGFVSELAAAVRGARGERRHELAEQLRAAEDPLAGRCEIRRAGKPLAAMPVLRADAVSPGPGRKSQRVQQLRPPYAPAGAQAAGNPVRRRKVQRNRASRQRDRPAEIRDRKRYSDRLKETRSATGRTDAIIVAHGEMGGHKAVVAVFDFSFMGGSMGIAVGNGILAGAQLAVLQDATFIVIPSSGGARMQEGILSLMQMPRTTIAVQQVREAGLPYIVVLADPTTGGVSASFAMLGDIALAEPGSIIGFAGARVIEETIREKLPEGFQRAEYLLEHGMIDMVVPRHELAAKLGLIIDLLRRKSPGADIVPIKSDASPPNRIRMAQMTDRPTRRTDAVLDRLTALHPKLIDLGLERTERLLTALGNPERALPPVIHVAGTNGKGSTVAFMAAIARAAGLRVHAYTSPHLVRFHERIALDGAPIDENDLLAVLEECEDANAGNPVTFFEITTAAAFLAFSRTPADLLLLETGLGGRFDSTNVIDRPAVTAITPVSMDHMSFLGDTVAEIAFEKAGILKPGVPGVIAPQPPDALQVIEARAQELDVALSIAGIDWASGPVAGGMVYQDEEGEIHLPPPGLAGEHQTVNAGTAIAALRCWKPGFWGLEDFSDGVSSASWPGRLQHLASGALAGRLPDGWELWLDGGHNPAAGAVLAETVSDWPDGQVVLVCAMQENKDAAGFLMPLAKAADRLIAIDLPGSSPGHPPDAIAALARAMGLKSQTAPSLDAALSAAPDGVAGRVLVCGSLYLAGEVLALNGA